MKEVVNEIENPFHISANLKIDMSGQCVPSFTYDVPTMNIDEI